MNQRVQRIDFIEGLRGLAAFYVVLQHIASMVDPYQRLRQATTPLAWALRPLWYGHLAVASFIVLSGFCLQWAQFKGSPDGECTYVGEFFGRRCRRILPPYYACLAASLLTCVLVTQYQKGLPWQQYVPVTRESLAAHVFMVHNLSPDWMYKINGVLWSIAIEFQLYFTYPWLARAIRLRPWLSYAVMGALLLGLSMALPASAKLYPWYAVLFAVGIGAARLARTYKQSYLHFNWFALLLGGAAIVSLHFTKLLIVPDMLWGIGVAVLLVGLLQGGWAPLKATLASKPLTKLGLFSYSLYLIHHPIIQVLTVNRPPTIPLVVWLTVVGIPLILVVAFGFFWVFERPFMRARGA